MSTPPPTTDVLAEMLASLLTTIRSPQTGERALPTALMALAGVAGELDERLRRGEPIPRVWTHRDEVIDRLPDGSPKTTRTQPLRVPQALRIPEGGGH
jgi:hypothetical protein